MNKLIYITISILTTVIVLSCSPNSSEESSEAKMFPDYDEITIPYNIAPLNFKIEGAKSINVKIKGDSEYSFRFRGSIAKFGVGKWHRMLEREKGNILSVSVTSKRGNEYSRTLKWQVSEDAIDKYLSYRLIEPAYEVWNEIQIEQRDMENFNSRLIADNNNAEKSCINCHTSNKNGTSFMHVRGEKGGTILNRDGRITKLNTKTDSTMGGAVYGDISTDGRYGVFTAANIKFAIHSHRSKRMEVYDSASDLIVIDLDSLTVTDGSTIKGDEFQETFPCFSADGKTIFFCRARHLEQPDSTKEMMYDVAAVTFDPKTGRVGDKVYTVLSSQRHNASFSHLKCSPDGKFLMVTASAYGTFPVWHEESELWLVNLRTGAVDIMSSANDRFADTYHSWSSNSRWVVFASKRDDKIYGRPYLVHIDEEGNVGKAFLLPQRNPDYYNLTLKSFNLPELYPQKEIYNARDISDIYNDSKIQSVTYKSNYK